LLKVAPTGIVIDHSRHTGNRVRPHRVFNDHPLGADVGGLPADPGLIAACILAALERSNITEAVTNIALFTIDATVEVAVNYWNTGTIVETNLFAAGHSDILSNLINPVLGLVVYIG